MPIEPFEGLRAFVKRSSYNKDTMVRVLYNGNIITYDPEWKNHPGVSEPDRPTPYPKFSGVFLTPDGKVDRLIAVENPREGTPEYPGMQSWGTVLPYMTESQIAASLYDTELAIDLEGRTVTVGLIDSHAHLAAWGMLLHDVYHKVNKPGTTAELVEELKTWAKEAKPDRIYWPWVIGHGYDGELPADRSMGEELNAILDSPGHRGWFLTKSGDPQWSVPPGWPEEEAPAPVFIHHSSGQTAWFNDIALNLFNDFEYNGGGGEHPLSRWTSEALPPSDAPVYGIGRHLKYWSCSQRADGRWEVHAIEEGAGTYNEFGKEVSNHTQTFNDLNPPFQVYVSDAPGERPPWDIDIYDAANDRIWTVLEVKQDPDIAGPNNKLLVFDSKFRPEDESGQVYQVRLNLTIRNNIWYIPKPIPPVIPVINAGEGTQVRYNPYRFPTTSIVGYRPVLDPKTGEPTHYELDYSILHYPLMRRFETFFSYFWKTNPLLEPEDRLPAYWEQKGSGAMPVNREDLGDLPPGAPLGEIPPDDHRKIVAKPVSQYHELGITSSHDCLFYRGGPNYDQYVNFSNLYMRMRLYYYVESLQAMISFYDQYLNPDLGESYDGTPKPWVKTLGWKIAVDGGTGAGTPGTQVPIMQPLPALDEVDVNGSYQLVDDLGNEVDPYGGERMRSFGLLVHTPWRPQEYESNLFDPGSENAPMNTAFIEEMEKGIFATDPSYLANSSLSDDHKSIITTLGLWTSESRKNLREMFRQARRWSFADPNVKHQVAVHALCDLAVGVSVRAIMDCLSGDFYSFYGGGWDPDPWDDGYGNIGDGDNPGYKDVDPRFRIEHGLWITKYSINDMCELNNKPIRWNAGANVRSGHAVMVSAQPHYIYTAGAAYRAWYAGESDPWPVAGWWFVDPDDPERPPGMRESWRSSHIVWGSRSFYIKPLRAIIANGIPLCLGADPPANPLPYPGIAFFGALNRGYWFGGESDQTNDDIVQEILDPKLEFDPDIYRFGKDKPEEAEDLFNLFEVGRRHPESQWIAMGDILASHTYWAAYGAHDESELGLIKTGYQGDFAIWNWNPLDVLNPNLPQTALAENPRYAQPQPYGDLNPVKAIKLLPQLPLGETDPGPILPDSEEEKLEQLTVEATIVGGKIVFVRNRWVPTTPIIETGEEEWQEKIKTHYFYHGDIIKTGGGDG